MVVCQKPGRNTRILCIAKTRSFWGRENADSFVQSQLLFICFLSKILVTPEYIFLNKNNSGIWLSWTRLRSLNLSAHFCFLEIFSTQNWRRSFFRSSALIFHLGCFTDNAFPPFILGVLAVCLSAFCFFANVTSLASLRSLQFIHSFLHIEWSTQQKSSFLSISSFSFTFPSQTLPRLSFSHLKNSVLVKFTNCEVPCSSG